MITAFYIEDGLEQIVLTPETEHEKKMLALLHDSSRTISIKSGAFYHCQGGWVRHGEILRGWSYGYENKRKDDESTMLVLRRGETAPINKAADQGVEEDMA